MTRVEASPYAVSRVCFPTLALVQQHGGSGTVSGGGHGRASISIAARRPSSDNHREYLSGLHAKKLAKRMKERQKSREDAMDDGTMSIESCRSRETMTSTTRSASTTRRMSMSLVAPFKSLLDAGREMRRLSITTPASEEKRKPMRKVSSCPHKVDGEGKEEDEEEEEGVRKRPRIFVKGKNEEERRTASHRRMGSEEERLIGEGVREWRRRRRLCIGWRREKSIGQMEWAVRANEEYLMRSSRELAVGWTRSMTMCDMGEVKEGRNGDVTARAGGNRIAELLDFF